MGLSKKGTKTPAHCSCRGEQECLPNCMASYTCEEKTQKVRGLQEFIGIGVIFNKCLHKLSWQSLQWFLYFSLEESDGPASWQMGWPLSDLPIHYLATNMEKTFEGIVLILGQCNRDIIYHIMMIDGLPKRGMLKGNRRIQSQTRMYTFGRPIHSVWPTLYTASTPYSS